MGLRVRLRRVSATDVCKEMQDMGESTKARQYLSCLASDVESGVIELTGGCHRERLLGWVEVLGAVSGLVQERCRSDERLLEKVMWVLCGLAGKVFAVLRAADVSVRDERGCCAAVTGCVQKTLGLLHVCSKHHSGRIRSTSVQCMTSLAAQVELVASSPHLLLPLSTQTALERIHDTQASVRASALTLLLHIAPLVTHLSSRKPITAFSTSTPPFAANLDFPAVCTLSTAGQSTRAIGELAYDSASPSGVGVAEVFCSEVLCRLAYLVRDGDQEVRVLAAKVVRCCAGVGDAAMLSCFGLEDWGLDKVEEREAAQRQARQQKKRRRTNVQHAAAHATTTLSEAHNAELGAAVRQRRDSISSDGTDESVSEAEKEVFDHPRIGPNLSTETTVATRRRKQPRHRELDCSGVLVLQLEDDSEDVRCEAVRSVCRLAAGVDGGRRAVQGMPFVMDLCFDESEVVRVAAMLCASDWSQQKAAHLTAQQVSLVLDSLLSPSPLVVRSALLTLGSLHFSRPDVLLSAVTSLLTLLSVRSLGPMFPLTRRVLQRIATQNALKLPPLLPHLFPPPYSPSPPPSVAKGLSTFLTAAVSAHPGLLRHIPFTPEIYARLHESQTMSPGIVFNRSAERRPSEVEPLYSIFHNGRVNKGLAAEKTAFRIRMPEVAESDGTVIQNAEGLTSPGNAELPSGCLGSVLRRTLRCLNEAESTVDGTARDTAPGSTESLEGVLIDLVAAVSRVFPLPKAWRSYVTSVFSVALRAAVQRGLFDENMLGRAGVHATSSVCDIPDHPLRVFREAAASVLVEEVKERLGWSSVGVRLRGPMVLPQRVTRPSLPWVMPVILLDAHCSIVTPFPRYNIGSSTAGLAFTVTPSAASCVSPCNWEIDWQLDIPFSVLRCLPTVKQSAAKADAKLLTVAMALRCNAMLPERHHEGASVPLCLAPFVLISNPQSIILTGY